MKQKSVLTFLFVVAGIAVISLVGHKAYQEAKRNQQIEDEINAIRAEAERIRKNNQDLRDRIAYFETADFQEKMAKEKLNFQKSDEEVVVIKSSPSSGILENKDETDYPETEKTDNSSNYIKWWKYFFNNSK